MDSLENSYQGLSREQKLPFLAWERGGHQPSQLLTIKPSNDTFMNSACTQLLPSLLSNFEHLMGSLECTLIPLVSSLGFFLCFDFPDSQILSTFFLFLIEFRETGERERKRERGASVCCPTYLLVDSFFKDFIYF